MIKHLIALPIMLIAFIGFPVGLLVGSFKLGYEAGQQVIDDIVAYHTKRRAP